ncbi:hypothetical protein U1Q18_051379 [Sarracenia purpurea var. burkii]
MGMQPVYAGMPHSFVTIQSTEMFNSFVNESWTTFGNPGHSFAKRVDNLRMQFGWGFRVRDGVAWLMNVARNDIVIRIIVMIVACLIRVPNSVWLGGRSGGEFMMGSSKC